MSQRAHHPGRRVVVMVVLGAVGVAAAGAWRPRARVEVTAADVVGLYRVEPAARGNPTTPLLFQRFAADGQTRLEVVYLRDGATGLTAEVRVDDARRTKRWAVAGGRLCIGAPGRERCGPVERDAVTGDLTVAGGQRLVRLRQHSVVE
jgi:hypothetical protein